MSTRHITYIGLLLAVLGLGSRTLAAPPPKKLLPPPKSSTTRKNGIRLVGGSGPRGRLEVSTKDSWVVGHTAGAIAWRPVCDDDYFTDDTAQAVCKLLGYKYGRKYYTAEVAFPEVQQESGSDSLASSNPLGNLMCYPKSNHRRNRRVLSTETASRGSNIGYQKTTSESGLGDVLEGDVLGRGLQGLDGSSKTALRGRTRSLLAPLRGTVNTPKKAPYTCVFQAGDCSASGPLAGVECSGKPFPPAPPPPPLPPSAPSPPPPGLPEVRMIGGSHIPTDVERNLCKGNKLCGIFGRVEMQVDAPGSDGEKVWAPLCASSDFAWVVGKYVCRQVFNYPDANPGVVWDVIPEFPMKGGYKIPTGEATDAGSFNPDEFEAWVAVASDKEYADVEDLTVQVSPWPCSNGRLFTLSCTIRMER